MSRKKQQNFNSGLSDGLDKFTQSVTGDVNPKNVVPAPANTSSRWFFLRNSAPTEELAPSFMEMNQKPWFAPFDCFWSNLAVRHRAIQLAATLEGQEFARFLTTIDLSAPIGKDISEYLAGEGWFAPLNEGSLFSDLCIRYVDKLTSVSDLNAHVTQRELQCFIPTPEGMILTSDVAKATYPVTTIVMSELQSWAINTLYRAHEAFTNPWVLDTVEGEIERLRSLTQQSALPDRIIQMTANHRDRTAVMRGRTLERRARVSRSVFFSQATKRGLDHDRASPRAGG